MEKETKEETRRVRWLWHADGYVQKACEKVDLEPSDDRDFVVILGRKWRDSCGVTGVRVQR